MSSKVGYFHFREYVGSRLLARGGMTVCYTTISMPHDGVEVLYSIARCSKKDNYSKKLGRKISYGRLIHGSRVQAFLLHPNNKDSLRFQVRRAIIQGLIAESS